MIQTTSIQQFNDQPLLVQLFLVLYLEKKGYAVTREIPFTQILELALALPMDLKYDTPAERTTFNNSIEYEDMFLGFDGREPIEGTFYGVTRRLKRMIDYAVSK